MSQVEAYLWRVYKIGPPSAYETTISETEPLVAPSDGSPIDPNETIILQSIFINISTDGYINLESKLADNQALKIRASDTSGGIDIDAGTGGITIDTTNTISLDASAESNFSTSSGNLLLESLTGLVNINGGSGINIGNDSSTTPVLIGTSDNLKHITIGSTNTTSSTTINSGTGGIIIGNTTVGGEVHIASNNNAKTIVIGNNAAFGRLFQRFGSGGWIRSQPVAVFIPDDDTNILISHLLTGILSGSPTTTRQLLLPTAANAVSGISGINVDDSIDFSVITNSIGTFTVVPGAGGSMDGNANVGFDTSGLFRLRYTNVTASSEAYIIYRIC